MSKRWLLTGGAALLIATCACAFVAHADMPEIAITVDDIPAHGPLPPGIDRRAVAAAVIVALKAHDAKPFGLFNASFGAGDPESSGVVAAWRGAGFPLGNHGYSHFDLDKVGAAPFLADIRRNETQLARTMASNDWHWFRYPFLHEGSDAATLASVRAGLRTDGYRIAAVTMSFDDFAWNAPYARCAAQHDSKAIAALETSYLAAARDEAGRERVRSRRLYGRDIPYVLLLHLGAFDARMLPRLLDLYRAMGFRFVPLAAAESDFFYAAARDLALAGPSPALDRIASARGLASMPAAAPTPGDTVCPQH